MALGSRRQNHRRKALLVAKEARTWSSGGVCNRERLTGFDAAGCESRLSTAGRMEGMGPMSEDEPGGSKIGTKASEMAGEIEVTARDLARVGQEITSLAGALASKVASVVGSRPEDAAGTEISEQAQEVAGAMRKTTDDALHIAQKAVEMASQITQAASRSGDTSPGEEPQS